MIFKFNAAKRKRAIGNRAKKLAANSYNRAYKIENLTQRYSELRLQYETSSKYNYK
tara:strand:+ start:651 stop:818 length:168 start_codon:yes stop_codon:yes gene_type:complete